MTTPVPDGPEPQPKPKKRYKVDPAAGGQLEQFLVAHKAAHDALIEAREREAETSKQIKAFLISLFPDGTGLPDAFDIAGDPYGRYTPYTMTLKGGSRVDVKLLQQENPAFYNHYLRPITPTWELRPSTPRGRRG